MYLIDIQEKAAEISCKSAEGLFSFTDGGPLHRRMETELDEIADRLEKAKKKKMLLRRPSKRLKKLINGKWKKMIKSGRK